MLTIKCLNDHKNDPIQIILLIWNKHENIITFVTFFLVNKKNKLKHFSSRSNIFIFFADVEKERESRGNDGKL